MLRKSIHHARAIVIGGAVVAVLGGVAILSDLAWAAYVRQDWKAASEAWQEVQFLDPYDPLAAVFLSRIAGMSDAAPRQDWGGTIILDKS